MQNKKGFTLVELSIVLVIIGLLVGGVLQGQELIEASKRQSVISDVTKYQVALNTFKLQYDGIAGDFDEAEDYWGNTATGNGDGDGKIENQRKFSPENAYAWQHLSLSEIIQGEYVLQSPVYSPTIPGTNIPGSAVDASGYNFIYLGFVESSPPGVAVEDGFFTGNYGQALLFGGDPTTNNVNHIGISPAVEVKFAKAIDDKIDDGNVATGKVVGSKPDLTVSVPRNCATSTDPATAKYKLTVDGIQCSIIFKLGNL